MAGCVNCNNTGRVPSNDPSTSSITCPVCGGRGWTFGVPPIIPPCDKPKPLVEEKPKEKVEEKPSGFQSHPFLRAMTYTKCPVCHGTRKMPTQVSTSKGMLPAGSECLMCPPHGFVETGLTVGQTERERAEKEALLEVVVKIYDSLASPLGAPNPVFALEVVKNWLGDVIKLMNKSDVSKARHELAQEERKSKRAGNLPPPLDIK